MLDATAEIGVVIDAKIIPAAVQKIMDCHELTVVRLPAGMQMISAEGEDLTTIEFARLLAAEIGGFVPPPAFI